MTILIIDATTTTRRTIRNTLERAGMHHLAESTGGEETLPRLRRLQPTVILVGGQIEGSTPLAFAAQLRASEAFAETPMLHLPSSCTDEDVLSAVEAGFDDLLVMPYQDEVLLEKVQRAFDRAAQAEAARRRRYRNQTFLSKG